MPKKRYLPPTLTRCHEAPVFHPAPAVGATGNVESESRPIESRSQFDQVRLRDIQGLRAI